MVLPDHVCPFGVRAKELLVSAGFDVDDKVLASREEVDRFEQEHGVDTTPQVFIAGERIGGSDALKEYLSGRGRATKIRPGMSLLALALVVVLLLGGLFVMVRHHNQGASLERPNKAV
jgi:glutaredoxin